MAIAGPNVYRGCSGQTLPVPDISSIDVVATMKEMIGAERSEIKKRISEASRMSSTLTQMSGRFRRRRSNAAENIFDVMLTSLTADAEKQSKVLKERLDVLTGVESIVEEYTYKWNSVQQAKFFPWTSSTSTTSL